MWHVATHIKEGNTEAIMAVRVMEAVRDAVNNGCDAVIGILKEDVEAEVPPVERAPVGATDQTGSPGAARAWSLVGKTFSGTFERLEELTGITYVWPDGNEDTYETFVVYGGLGDFGGMTLALGYN